MSCACLSSSRLKFSAEPMKQRSCPRNGHVLLQAVQAAQLSINARRDSSYRGYSSYSNCGNAMQCGSILDQGSQLRAREGGQELSPLTKCGLVKASRAKASRTPYVALNETRARRWMAGELRLAYIANPAHTTSDRCERNLRSLAVWLRPLSCIMIVEVWMSRLRNKHGSLPHA